MCELRKLCIQKGGRRSNDSLPAAHGPAAPGSHLHTPGHSAGLEASHQGPLLGGKLLPVPRVAS